MEIGEPFQQVFWSKFNTIHLLDKVLIILVSTASVKCSSRNNASAAITFIAAEAL